MSQLEDTIPLASIQATLALAEIYDKVELASAPEVEVDNRVSR